MPQRILIKDAINKINENILLKGWVDVRRDHGKLIFLDLRDRSGVVQIVVTPKAEQAYKIAETVRPEWVVEAIGLASERPEKMKNSDLKTGGIEIKVAELKVLSPAETPPIDVSGKGDEINEEARLKYRYLDLRRPRLQKNLRNRHRAAKFIRDFLTERDFLEIETPILTKSTPEGARDYVAPSRLHPGKFYALPQSPQQYKQLLMVAGFERYFQIARCFRDEDTRGDRQPEFTQVDIEMSFMSQEEILNLIEEMFCKMVVKLYPDKKITRTPWPRLDYEEAMEKYGSDRPDLRKNKNDSDELAFAWIINFPLFEKEKKDGHWAPGHHMFTAPKEEDLPKLETSPEQVRSYQHDLVLNGCEIGGGSIRIHDLKIQKKIFDLIGFSKKDTAYFEHMLTAFKYGAPPHGGIAPGLDRLLMILENEPNIREVIAFPKTGDGRDLMMDAPSEISKEQMKELKIKIK
ncbi:MAG: aspartate--tRNA ligase [Candidatus Niyogibacteria bacterium]|nr:aspartate--tRNA ligase [Candidatus Niyogibacteria bacterium]